MLKVAFLNSFVQTRSHFQDFVRSRSKFFYMQTPEPLRLGFVSAVGVWGMFSQKILKNEPLKSVEIAF